MNFVTDLEEGCYSCDGTLVYVADKDNTAQFSVSGTSATQTITITQTTNCEIPSSSETSNLQSNSQATSQEQSRTSSSNINDSTDNSDHASASDGDDSVYHADSAQKTAATMVLLAILAVYLV